MTASGDSEEDHVRISQRLVDRVKLSESTRQNSNRQVGKVADIYKKKSAFI